MIEKIEAKKIKDTIEGFVEFHADKVRYKAAFSIFQNSLRNSLTIKKISRWSPRAANYIDKIEADSKLFSELKKKIGTALLASKSLLATGTQGIPVEESQAPQQVSDKPQTERRVFGSTIKMIDPKLLKINPYQKEWFSDGKINNEKRLQMLGSVKKYGIKTPLKLTQDYTIIGGHRRHSIALELRLSEVPCQVALHELTDDELQLHTIEDNYLQRETPSRFRAKIYKDLVDLVIKQLPNWEHLIRGNKQGLYEKLQDMGFSYVTANKIIGQEKRKAAKTDNARRSGLIQTNWMSMSKNLQSLVTVYATTNEYTREKMKPNIIKKLTEAGILDP